MVSLNVNGLSVEADTTPDTPLLWVLRDHLAGQVERLSQRATMLVYFEE